MNREDYKHVFAEVERILQENFVVAPPIKIDEIVRNYGLSLAAVDFSSSPEWKDVAGYLNAQERKIYLNSADSGARQAFTVAHELGHWLLHRDKLDDPDYAILYRKPLGEKGTDTIEKEANVFAANLLVPRALLDKYKDDDAGRIAKIFGVSSDVIGYRLKDEYGIQVG